MGTSVRLRFYENVKIHFYFIGAKFNLNRSMCRKTANWKRVQFRRRTLNAIKRSASKSAEIKFVRFDENSSPC